MMGTQTIAPDMMGSGMLFLQPNQAVPVGPGMMGPGMSDYGAGIMQHGMVKGPGTMMGASIDTA